MKRKFMLGLTMVVLCLILSSCARVPVNEIETIATRLYDFPGVAYNIQLRIDNIIFAPFGLVSTTNPAELDVPLGEKIGVAQGFDFISIYSIYGYSPNEWLYGVYDNNGGITLFKADNVTEIPMPFYELQYE